MGASRIASLQMVDNKDKARTFVTIYMHRNRLYLLEATAPANFPPPSLFVESIYLKEENGAFVNHERMYFNGNEIDPQELNEFVIGPNGEVSRRPGSDQGADRLKAIQNQRR